MGVGAGGQAMHADGHAAGGGDSGRFELAPWQRVVRTGGLSVSGAGLAATVCGAFTILFPNVALFREPQPFYGAPWTDIQLEYLPACFIFAVLFASLVDLFFSPRTCEWKPFTRLTIRHGEYFAIVGLPFVLLDHLDAEEVSADPVPGAMLIFTACSLCLLLALLWPTVGPRLVRPRGLFDLWELLILAAMALSYPAALVQVAMTGSSPYIFSAIFYIVIVGGGMRREPRKRAGQDSGGAGEAGSKA